MGGQHGKSPKRVMYIHQSECAIARGCPKHTALQSKGKTQPALFTELAHAERANFFNCIRCPSLGDGIVLAEHFDSPV
eukprot:300328-Amphidinium_carterae.1